MNMKKMLTVLTVSLGLGLAGLAPQVQASERDGYRGHNGGHQYNSHSRHNKSIERHAYRKGYRDAKRHARQQRHWKRHDRKHHYNAYPRHVQRGDYRGHHRYPHHDAPRHGSGRYRNHDVRVVFKF
ncbi:hypothetical protein [Sulfuriflexus mobilis]|uniref:hypothetical protein n=1 Tax=Sulfuriflexus mobilis TaxID=1811807 RepID=UPI000F84BC29|nr:hypothetical protein [Sulfuriflexus mobilis]